MTRAFAAGHAFADAATLFPRAPQRLLACLLGALVAGQALPARAGSVYPERPVRIVCPATAGGSIDAGARIIAAQLSARLGQRFVIDNRPGAGTTLGTRAVAEAAPDGYTLLVVASPVFSIGPQLYASARYDPVQSFTPIGSFGRSAPFLVVAARSPWLSLAELVEAARTRPGELKVAHFGAGGASHLPAELWRRAAGIELSFVPYKSEADSYTDLVAGRIDAAFYYGPLAVPQVQAGRLRALAHADVRRSAALPEVPTLAESGHPGAEFHIEWLLLGPAGLPPAVVQRLAGELAALAGRAEVHSALAAGGADAAVGTPAQAAELIVREREAKGRLLRQLGIDPQ